MAQNVTQIEAWALSVIDRVTQGHNVEDSRVELKAEWLTDTAKAARRLAGHANSAGGQPILWLIGVDEKAGVTKAEPAELANWYPQVQAQFDGISPHITAVNVPVGNSAVMALLFETDRRPYVVRNPSHGRPEGGPVELEVPWRDGTRVRSARREDLIRLPAPVQLAPDVEIISGVLTVRNSRSRSDDPNGDYSGIYLDLKLYIVPGSENRVVIPFHRCEFAAETSSKCNNRIEFKDVRLTPPHIWQVGPDSMTIASTGSEALIDGPGMAALAASIEMKTDMLPYPFPPDKAEIIGRLYLAGSRTHVPIAATLHLEPFDPALKANQQFHWRS